MSDFLTPSNLKALNLGIAFRAINILGGNRKPYVESLNSRSVLPHGPPYGSNWGHKIADFEFLAYISFIVAFIASECIKRYWESVYGESK